MADIDVVLIDNFKEALRQANRYLTLGLFSSLFYLTLSVDPAAFSSGNVSLPGVLPPLPLGYARLALGLLYWVSPFLAAFALARAERVGEQLLKSNEALFKAAASFPSIATTRVHGPRWVVALLPPLLFAIAGWANHLFSLATERLVLLLFAVLPYLVLFGSKLRRSFGNFGPDLFGD